MENFMSFFIEKFSTIATVLLTAAVGAYFLWRNNYKTRRANACAAFRAVIERELGSMLTKFPTESQEINRRLKQVFPVLESAVREFRNFVPWWKKRGFNRAWLCYHCAYPENLKDGQCYHHYFRSHSPENPPPDSKAIFRANVERLMSYAKET